MSTQHSTLTTSIEISVEIFRCLMDPFIFFLFVLLSFFGEVDVWLGIRSATVLIFELRVISVFFDLGTLYPVEMKAH